MKPDLAPTASERPQLVPTKSGLKSGSVFLEVMRPHHTVKNLLVFLPLIASHRYSDPVALRQALLAFFTLSLAASATYIINDIRDLAADRLHPHKKNRAIASNRLAPKIAAIFAAVLMLTAAVCASFLPAAFAAYLTAYIVVTMAYTFALKRVVILDVLIIAGLFVLRVLAGGAATGINPSFWLLAFSMFVFLSIALAKRVTELRSAVERSVTSLPGRSYQPDDHWALTAMGIASGFVAVLVIALYVNSSEVRLLYRTPDLIWLACPIGLYIITRLWFLAVRGEVDEDPVLFVLKDRPSQAAMLVAGVVAFLAR
jgi:4-hydroxybenzoate polyprenyltransferase